MSNIDKRPLKPGTYAILFRNNWDGEGDVYETLATLSNDLVWYHYENGNALIEYEGDEVLKAWPLDDGSNMLALLDELEAKDKRIAELEDIAKSVKFDPIPMEDLGNKSDGKKHPYMFGAGYNSAVVHCESVLLQAFAAAAGKGA